MANDRVHGRVVSESPESYHCVDWPTRRTRTTSRVSRTSAPTRSSTPTRRSSTSTTASSCCASSTGSSTTEHHWIFEWTAPFERLVFANKFGYPQGILTRVGDYRDVPSLWWIDPEKAQKLEAAMKDPSINLGEGPADDKYWLEFTESAPASPTRHRAVTAYFIRRLLLIIPTFIGITLVVFVIMHFVPGGPVERQIMRYKMAQRWRAAAEGGSLRMRAARRSAIEEIRRLLRLRQARSHPLSRVAGERRPARSRQLLHLPGSGLGCDQVAVSRLVLPRA